MDLKKSLFFLSLGVIVAIGVLHVSFSRYSLSQNILGCSGLESDIDTTQTLAFWQDQPIAPPNYLAESLSEFEKKVLGDSSDEKWIEIDLGHQKLIAHQGNTIFLESLISSGLWNKTPVGEYRIWYKARSLKMEGGIKGTKSYYYLPNVPYAMFFKGDYGIHGTYWHSNFGTRMSHGCVNSPTVIAEKLFYWTNPQLPSGKLSVRATINNPGTRVVVHD